MSKIIATVSHFTPNLNGIDMIRINGAFGDFDEYVQTMERFRDVPILIDLPGKRRKPRTSRHSDESLIDFALKHSADYVGVSYAEQPEDIAKVRAALGEGRTGVICKIETHQAMENIEPILKVSDGAMLDRDDLLNEFDWNSILLAQRHLVRCCEKLSKLSIIASGFLRSMLENDEAQERDILDIYRAVMDGASFIVLSEETAIGSNPQRVIDRMIRIINRTKNGYAHPHL